MVIGAAVSWLERLAPDVEHGVGADQRVAQRGGLLGVEALGVGAVVGLGEVDVARHPQQRIGAERGAGAMVAGGDVGLDRAEVAAAVEDDGDGLRQRQVAHLQRNRNGGLLVHECAAQQVVGAIPLRSARFLHVPLDPASSSQTG